MHGLQPNVVPAEQASMPYEPCLCVQGVPDVVDETDFYTLLARAPDLPLLIVRSVCMPSP